MTTVAAYPLNDIRSMFRGPNGSIKTPANSIIELKSKESKESNKEKDEKKPAAYKKAEKKDEIDYLCDAYYKLISKNKSDNAADKSKIKELVKEIVEHFGIRPKKLYRYFHFIRYNSVKTLSLELMLEEPFKFITFKNQFISYKDAMNICIDKNIFPELQMRVTAWIYDYFIGKQNKYYISIDDSVKLLSEFSNEFIKEGKAAEKILFGTLVQIEFGHKTFFTTQEFINYEKKIGDTVLDLFHHDEDVRQGTEETEETARIEDHIKSYIKKQNKDDFQFEPEQLEAIHRGCGLKRGEMFIITGPPGTGKSTIVNCIVNHKLEHGSCIAIMAPTGLAQKNLKNSCKYDSIYDTTEKIMFSTLHRALNFTFVQGSKDAAVDDKSGKEKEKEKEIDFKPDVLIVDEASMIDLDLFYKLLKACKWFNSSLILIGDVNQLPPIGPGIPFESIIKSELFNTTKLINIKRQDGNLKEIVEKMNKPNGVVPDDFDGECSVFIEAKTSAEIENAVAEIYKKEMSRDPNADIHTMCAQRKDGVHQLNPIIQKLKNKGGVELFVKKYEDGFQHAFHEGDLVMRTENDYKDEKNVRVNGDIGTIHESRMKSRKNGKDVWEYVYTVKYHTCDGNVDEEKNLSVEDVRDSFVPFYASTVHKMQGLQKTTIVFVVPLYHRFMLTNETSKKLVYTAISRCKANFYIVGDKSLFIRSQQSKGEHVCPTRFMKEFSKYDIEI
jgi:exodeoxyribonuclease V alpha subunit